MKKIVKLLSLFVTIALLIFVASCSSDPDLNALVSQAKEKINSLNIPTLVSEEFADISLYQSDIEYVTVEYSVNSEASDYLKIEEYKLKYLGLPSSKLDASLTASIKASYGENSVTDEVVFNITLEKAVDPTIPMYEVSVVGINGRKLAGTLVTFELNGEEVASGETDEKGLYQVNLEPNVYDVTLYAPRGFVFEDGTDVYETKSDRSLTPINVSCTPTLISNQTAPVNHTYSVGDQMYDFSVESYNPQSGTWGNTWTLSEKLAENDLVIINFWYSTCSWCLEEFPVLVETYNSYLEQGFDLTLIGITYSGADDEDSVRAAALQYGLNFELAISDEMNTMFAVTGYPTTVFIDRYGTADYIESGAITSASRWANIFDGYLGEDYVPTYKGSEENGGQEQIVPDVPFPGSSALEGVLNQSGFVATYAPETAEPDATYSWPFIVSGDGSAVVPSNSGVDNSYAIMYMNVELKAGQAFAFDYKASTEEDLDNLYLIYDGAIIATFTGVDSDFVTYYPFVADKDGVYEFSFVYMKDQMASDGDDTVYLKNFRYVEPTSIPEPLFVIREASNDLDIVNGGYLNYVNVVFNENDGYYHVNDINGPLLLADLMSASHFSNDTLLSYAETDTFTSLVNGVSVNDLIIRYAQYAANSLTQGYTPVTEELKEVLEAIADEIGENEINKDKQWLEMTVYYNVYGDYSGDSRVDQSTGQIIDPTIGLAHHNAITVENLDISNSLNPDGSIKDDVTSTVVAGSVEYTMDRFITTRGFYFAFVPEHSGVYLVYGKSGNSTDCYIEGIDYDIYAQANFEIREYYALQAEGIIVNDFRLYAYLEAGETYYIVPFYSNYGDYGNVSMDVVYLGSEYVILEKASSFAYTTSSDFTEGDTSDIEDIIISVGIDVILGDDGYYYELYSDGTYSKDPLYFDFIYSNMLINMTFEDALAKDPNTFDMSLSDYGDSIIDSEGYLVEWTYTLNTETGETTKESHRVLDDNKQPILADKTLYRDWTSDVREWLNSSLYISDPDHSAYGCIAVNEEVKTLLELLMNKYSFKNVEGSWLKLCYYYKYYGPNEHAADVNQ